MLDIDFSLTLSLRIVFFFFKNSFLNCVILDFEELISTVAVNLFPLKESFPPVLSCLRARSIETHIEKNVNDF